MTHEHAVAYIQHGIEQHAYKCRGKHGEEKALDPAVPKVKFISIHFACN